MKLENKIETLPEKEIFITLKNHKPNFINNPKYRLINPAKSNIGKVNLKLLNFINSKFGQKSLSCNSAILLQKYEVSWFRNFPNKKKCKFLVFDFVDF